MKTAKGSPTSIYLEDDVKEILNVVAESNATSRSDVVNTVVRNFFKSARGEPRRLLRLWSELRPRIDRWNQGDGRRDTLQSAGRQDDKVQRLLASLRRIRDEGASGLVDPVLYAKKALESEGDGLE